MKKRKSTALFAVLLCLLLSLSACKGPAAQQPGSTRPVAQKSEWTTVSTRAGTLSGRGYYYLNRKFLCFADTQNGVSVYLCSKAGCLHAQEPDGQKQDDCEASLSAATFTPFFFWDDHLYYVLSNSFNFSGDGTQVYRRDAAGTGLETVATLGARHTEQGKSVTVYGTVASGGYLYYKAEVDGPRKYENGVSVDTWETNYIGRLDLRTGKEEILLEDPNAEITLFAATEDAVLFHSVPTLTLDIGDPNYREESAKRPASLRRWDAETGKVTVLFEKTNGEFSGMKAVSQDKLYYTDSSVTYEYDLITGTHRVVSENSSLQIIGNGYALQDGSQEGERQLYDLNTQQILPCTVTELFSVVAVSDRGFVVEYNVKTAAEKARYVCYVAYEALSDGLQEGDLLVLDKIKMDA